MRPRAAAAVLRFVGGAKSNPAAVALALLWAALAFLYLYNIDGSLMHDDEGTDLYEVWRLQLGEGPGVDFMAEQQPLYLLAGATLLDLFGHEVLPLRLLAALQVLTGAAVFVYAVARVFSVRTAAFALVLVLTSGMVYEQARLFRPDPMMLGWELIGLALAMLAVKQDRWVLWGASGVAYGVALNWKPFALFPLIGIVLFLLANLVLQPQARGRFFRQGVVFGLTFALVGGIATVVLHWQFGFYYLVSLRQHSTLGQGAGLPSNLVGPLTGYIEILVSNLVYLFLPTLWLLNKPVIQPERRGQLNVLLWQLVTPLLFVLITRRFYVRFLIYLVPVLAIMLGWQLEQMVAKLGVRWHERLIAAVLACGIVVLGTAVTHPMLSHHLTVREADSLALAAYVAHYSDPEDVVLSDYAGINLLARRLSIYEATIIAGGRIEGGIVNTDMLLERIEEEGVAMVLIHVEGGDPFPHQLVRLDDYERFRAYVQSHFTLLTEFDRSGQIIEVYSRR
jgi:4-amino-4-deoxy-L-arabinose transferase-like glycosyltransferase